MAEAEPRARHGMMKNFSEWNYELLCMRAGTRPSARRRLELQLSTTDWVADSPSPITLVLLFRSSLRCYLCPRLCTHLLTGSD